MGKFKTILIFALMSILSIPTTTAQTVPQGMKYQAIARTSNGDLIKEKPISMMISLQSIDPSKAVHYIELHDTTTNLLGLFSLTIGEGEAFKGEFIKIPWGTEDIWMEIAIKTDEGEFKTLSSTKLLAVPYAFHAATASEISNKKTKEIGVPANVWSLKGNYNTDPTVDKLGTTDSTDFVMVTDNIERLRITADGQIITGDGKFTIGGNLEVQGDSTRINKDLYVGRNVVLNFDDGFNPRGETINHGNFTVEGMSSSLLTGTLDVEGHTNLMDSLTVDGYSLFKSDVTLDHNLTVLDSTISRSLLVRDDVADGGFLATFENTNTSQGDGIKIKLGQKATKNNSTSEGIDTALKVFVGEGFGPSDFATVKGLLDGDLSPSDLAYLALLQVPTTEDLLAIAATACNLTEVIGNSLIDFLNSNLSLPATIGPYGIDTDILTVNVVPLITVIPEIPSLDLPCEALGDGFQLPSLGLADIYVSNPLDSENTFIEFTDNEDWTMGGIKAQSIENWAIQYLDPVFLYDLYSTFKGLDKAKILPEMRTKGKEIAKAYLAIGVQYSSGNGDYAEWLERSNPNEAISAGDIVAVKGGKITKDLTNAEQIMAVSHRPIVLGNIPKDGKKYLGNNVAFMGQIPVKIMGPVATGDYIVARGEIKGYGVAISPEDMTIEDFKRTVGRSWDADLDEGPKMINTVVGIHNGDYLNILKRYEEKFQNSEERLESLEAKVNILVNKTTSEDIHK